MNFDGLDGQLGVDLDVGLSDDGGTLKLYNDAGVQTIELDGEDGLSGSIELFNEAGFRTVEMEGDNLGEGGRIELKKDTGELRLGSLATLLRDDPERLERVLARHASFDEHPFVALNTALWTDGAFIHIPEGAVIEQPIHVLYLTTSRAAAGVAHPRNLILADRFAQATIVESYAGLSSDQYWSNPVTEVVAGEGAEVAHYKIQRESLSAFTDSGTSSSCSRDASVIGRSEYLKE